jgi:AraC-like DNA-binding protein
MSNSIVSPSHPLLKSVIEYFWTLEGTPTSTEDTALIYPEGCFEIILSFDAPTRWVSGDQEIDLPASFISPIRTSYYDIHPQGHVEYLAIRFHPTAFPILNLPAVEYGNKAVPLDDVLDVKMRHLIAPVYTMESMAERITYLEKVFVDLLMDRVRHHPSDFGQAIKLINQSFGKAPIQLICEQSELYPRKLERYFDQFMGVTPKTYARIVRFNFAVQKYLSAPDKGVGSLIYQAGYADQAHFIRECRSFTGRTPGELLVL